MSSSSTSNISSVTPISRVRSSVLYIRSLPPTVSCLSVVHLLSCLPEACLHLMKNVMWWACSTQVGNKLNKVSFLFCITVVLFNSLSSCSAFSAKLRNRSLWVWIQRLTVVNIHAAAIAQTVRSTLINDVLFITCNGTQRHDSHQLLLAFGASLPRGQT